jgi:hypothetical protein
MTILFYFKEDSLKKDAIETELEKSTKQDKSVDLTTMEMY